jgi:hypothetical protein
MNTEQIEQLAVKHEAFGFGLVDAKGYTTHGFDPEGLHAFVTELTEALAQERDALFGSQELIAHVAAALSERMTLAENKCEKYQEENKSLRDAMKPDMFWNNDDAETLYHSIGEFLNDEICNGSLEVGDVRIIQQAKRLPNITIQVTSIDENECEADWEIVPALTRKQS